MRRRRKRNGGGRGRVRPGAGRAADAAALGERVRSWYKAPAAQARIIATDNERQRITKAAVRSQGSMNPGFYTIIAAQFFSSLADNALLIAAIARLRELHEPLWMTPALKQSFVLSYVLLAPVVGAFADSMPKGRVMLITNAIKVVGCAMMLFDFHPLLSYAIVGAA